MPCLLQQGMLFSQHLSSTIAARGDTLPPSVAKGEMMHCDQSPPCLLFMQ